MRKLLLALVLLGGCFTYHRDLGANDGMNFYRCGMYCGVNGFRKFVLYSHRYCKCE